MADQKERENTWYTRQSGKKEKSGEKKKKAGKKRKKREKSITLIASPIFSKMSVEKRLLFVSPTEIDFRVIWSVAWENGEGLAIFIVVEVIFGMHRITHEKTITHTKTHK